MFLCTSGKMVPLNHVLHRKALSFNIQDKVLMIFEPTLDHVQGFTRKSFRKAFE